MKQRLFNISLLVNDYDEAISFYTNSLGFEVEEDTPLSDIKRWVRIKPFGSEGICLLLAKAANEEQKSRVGNQTGGRVFLFLETDDIQRDYQLLKKNDVQIVRELSKEPYGSVLFFSDLYGNLFDLIEPIKNS